MNNDEKYLEVYNYFKEYNCILISKTYQNCDTKLKYICSCGNEDITTYRSFKRSKYHKCHRCLNKIASKRNTKSQEDAEYFFKIEGCELIDQYVSNTKPLKFICKCGKIGYKAFNNFSKAPCCKECSYETLRNKQKYSYEYVRNIFESHGCKLLDGIYINCKTKLKYIAKCGHEDETTLDCFIHNKHHLCKKCCNEVNSGENAYNWNGGYDNELEKFRKTYEFKKWHTDVFKRDNYTCQCCGDKKENLNVHHLDGYNWCIEKRTDINNGITLCESCHKKFHLKYGYGNNTKEQFEEFLPIQKELNI